MSGRFPTQLRGSLRNEAFPGTNGRRPALRGGAAHDGEYTYHDGGPLHIGDVRYTTGRFPARRGGFLHGGEVSYTTERFLHVKDASYTTGRFPARQRGSLHDRKIPFTFTAGRSPT